MLGMGYSFFIGVASESGKCTLYPAEISAVDNDVYTSEIIVGDLILDVGQEFLVYYEMQKKFVKQSAKVNSVDAVEPTEEEDTEAKSAVQFETFGEPASAESRQEFRVLTVMNDLYCSIGEESKCSVVDLSAKGLAVLAETKYRIGKILDVDLRYNGDRFAGKACVVSLKERREGLQRYGLRCVDRNKSKDNLARGLFQVSMTLQREQLRRLSRAK